MNPARRSFLTMLSGLGALALPWLRRPEAPLPPPEGQAPSTPSHVIACCQVVCTRCGRGRLHEQSLSSGLVCDFELGCPHCGRKGGCRIRSVKLVNLPRWTRVLFFGDPSAPDLEYSFKKIEPRKLDADQQRFVHSYLASGHPSSGGDA
jgi:hypothetical protein